MSRPCPSCGHCPTCGRGARAREYWWTPYPYYYYDGFSYGTVTNTTNTVGGLFDALAQPETKCDHGHDPDEGK